jgi:NAD-dependent DNA ligase
MDPRTWYFLTPLNQIRGPVSSADLDTLLREQDTHVWCEGMEDWVLGSEHFASAPTLRSRSAGTNAHGQPAPAFGAARVSARSFDELMGFVRGILADGEVSEAEAKSLLKWCENNPYAVAEWPGREIAARLTRVFEDGVVTEEERADLVALMQAVSGGQPDAPSGIGRSTRLPLNDPVPELAFVGKTFVFTGQFVYGTRNACEAEVIQRGGHCSSGVTRGVHFVVIGELCSRDWLYSTHGTKIQKAVEYRDKRGVPIAIVPEDTWVAALASS